MMVVLSRWLAAVAFALALHAQVPDVKLPAIAEGVGFDQRLGAKLSLGLPFVDEQGRNVAIGSVFGGGPVIFAPVYYQCPQLCNLTLNGLFKAIRQLPSAERSKLSVIALSFDPRDTPATAMSKRESYAALLHKDAMPGQIHFLTGGEANIQTAMRAVGFRYRWDPDRLQFAHASGIVVMTKLSRSISLGSITRLAN